MSWRSLRVRSSNGRDRLLAALFAAGSGGVQEEGDALITHFPESADLAALTARLRELEPDAAIEVADTPAVDWSEAWKGAVRARTIGALTIMPPWEGRRTRDEGREEQFLVPHPSSLVPPNLTVIIDPGMAFGTGEHATTRGVLALMQRVVRQGDRVADLGAGSAILSIAAVRLGAAWAAAIESDPEAIGNAVENVARNDVAGRVAVLEGDARVFLLLVAPVRVVFANIISSVLLDLLDEIAAALSDDGVAILSGILVAERSAMLDAFAADWRVLDELEDEGWWTVTIARR
ncbi:MAG TPA: 50S ribosomal protein L11 methyltransferase [Gemmatimonadaceae bacterium]|nr:50S ribosomal protein L11 methyltransferase [Gemmatimonadaceae bacterium]